MDFGFIKEPLLEFGTDKHICPRMGIYQNDVFDSNFPSRKHQIFIGGVGTGDNLEALREHFEWLRSYIPAKEGNKQPGFFPPFPGFNEQNGFKISLDLHDLNCKKISPLEISEIADESYSFNQRVDIAAQHYFDKIQYLAENRNVDVVVCVIPNSIIPFIESKEAIKLEEKLEYEEDYFPELEFDFRRLLKSKVMKLKVPIQLIREDTLTPFIKKKAKQDDATRAWNLSVALYYKAQQNTVPWRLPRDSQRPPTCYIGISFYRSRDKKTIHTSVAQVFDELGHGVILRGNEVELDKDDRIPHLKEHEAYDVLKNALSKYKVALEHSPSRVVIHKSSKFYKDEADGFQSALFDCQVTHFDLITIRDSPFRMFRNGDYPVARGAYLTFNSKHHLLYTKGSSFFYKTYAGPYIPQPIEIEIYENEESAKTILQEILALTKMNWNNTQHDGKYPITLACSRKVGEILKYLDDTKEPQMRYAYYM